MKRRRIARSRAKKGLPPTVPIMRMARKCCVPNCEIDVQEARNKGLPLHKFPKDAVLRGRWLTGAPFGSNFKPTPGQIVCHRHFKRADYEAANKTNKLTLKKGSVPSVFTDYDNHPDPVIMSVKTSTSYAQEDLDLINAEILNMTHSPLLSEDRTSKIDSTNETSKPESSADSVNLSETSNLTSQECKSLSLENDSSTKKEESSNDPDVKVNSMAVQLGIVEPETTIQNVSKDLILTTELNGLKEVDEKEFDKVNDSKAKMLNRGSLKFYQGAKLEAKDFNEKWYSAKVVETDWEEREVLIHFDNWSARYDEWIPMDSSRLRVLQTVPNEQTWVLPSPETPSMKEFAVGERILATWVDGRKYPAKVNAVLGNDKYDVLFDDGYAKIIRSSKMTKCTTPPKTQQPVRGDSYIGSKQERRDKKRKHTVMELFHTHSRKRSRHDGDKTTKKEESVSHSNVESFPESKFDLDGTLFGPCYDPGTDLLRGFNTTVPKPKPIPKKNKKEMHKSDTEQEEHVGPAWIDGEPQGIESYIVDGNDGPRRSIIVHDKRLPPGWQKHFTQRKAGNSAGKWDVLFIHKSTGKKFRSRNDIRIFMENKGQFDFDPEKFDFCIHRKKRNHAQKLKQEQTTPEVPKKIKTLLPKVKTPVSNENTSLASLNTPVNIPVTSPGITGTPINNGAVFIGGLRVEMEDSAYKCPKQGCNKTFRKENLLQMHIKHYHPEYSKFLGSTPNVADLAYARTIGESVEDIIPKKATPLLDKVHKFGKKKASQERSPATLTQSGLNFVQPSSPFVSVPSFEEREDEVNHVEKFNDLHKEDIKIETMSPMSNHSIEIDEDIEKRKENSCAMSPDTLFDMKIREERPEKVGIKTLLPVVRPPVTSEVQKVDRSKSLDDPLHIEKGKGQRKRQLSEYSSDVPSKGKKRHGMPDIVDDYGDLDDSALDAEGPTAPMYRYSRRKSDCKSDENSQNKSEGVMMMINGEMVKVEQLRREEIINCTCGFMEEDGLMIQCDLCLCWQHGHCNSIEKEKDVPEKYVCYICRNPFRERPSKKYYHDQDWIKEGKLPSLSTRTKNQNTLNTRTAILKRSYDLVSALLQMQQILHSLRVKINVAQKKDHPKLYLWAKNWEKLDVPKPDTEPVPVMEIIKTPVDFIDTSSETSRRTDVKIETKTSVKDDHDDKSIASDSELMKILEEDSSNSDESKVMCKKEDLSNSKGGHILLDALTRNGSQNEKQKLKHENLTENINTHGSEDSKSASGLFADNIHGETDVPEIELLTPLQPFIPEPEAPIDSAECRMRLLEHIDHFQSHIESRLISLEAQVAALEAMDSDEIIPSPDVQPRTKQTVQMLLKDLNKVRKLAALC